MTPRPADRSAEEIADDLRSIYAESMDLISRAITTVIRGGSEDTSSVVVPLLNGARHVLSEAARQGPWLGLVIREDS